MSWLRKYQSLLGLVLSFTLALLIISVFFREKKNFENLALGIYTKSYFGKVKNRPVQTMGFRDQALVINGCKERNEKDLVLIIGNSQTHSINQYKKGDVTFTELLADSLNKESIDVISSSIPNATLEDFYLLYKGWKNKLPVKAMLVPVFLDDTREVGIQDVFYKDLGAFSINDTNTVALRVNAQLKVLAHTETTEFKALDQTFQERTENGLDTYLDKHFVPWHLRPNVRGDFFNNLYKLRNTVFGIDAKTKRGVIKNSYTRNLDALKALLEDCRKDSLPVLVYIPPIRNDVEMPYYQDEYEAFKKEIQSICASCGARFKNMESVVPNQYWGLKGTRTFKGLVDLDFMHFQYAGHIIMADTLQGEIKKLLNR